MIVEGGHKEGAQNLKGEHNDGAQKFKGAAVPRYDALAKALVWTTLPETGTSSRELYAVAARKGVEDSASEESSSEMYCFCATMVESVMNELAIRKTLTN